MIFRPTKTALYYGSGNRVNIDSWKVLRREGLLAEKTPFV
jgi:hypothetical protein